jgi:hypothetical protein
MVQMPNFVCVLLCALLFSGREANAACVSYAVTLTDSYGADWDGALDVTRLFVCDDPFTLSNGYSGTDTVCLPNGTSSPFVRMGLYPSNFFGVLAVSVTARLALVQILARVEASRCAMLL